MAHSIKHPLRGDPAIIEAVTEQDRLYFLQRPGVTRYTRHAVLGEGEDLLPGDSIENWFVEVNELVPGIRSRRFFRIGLLETVV